MGVSGKTIYLDNAATTFPKPPEVLREMVEAYSALGVSPGRGSYDLSTEAEDRVRDTRYRLCRFFGGRDPEHVTFCYNATDGLNMLIRGLVKPGTHVVSSRLEHNSVLRPLHYFSEEGAIGLDLVPFDREGVIDPDGVAAAIRRDTEFVIVTHGSNVLGTVQPVQEIARVCQRHGVALILDVSQTAGHVPVRMDEWGVSAVAFTGHKALLGPTGIGGLVLNPVMDVRPSRFGGTGRESSSLKQNEEFPHRLEAGTVNVLGVLGLAAGLSYIEGEGMEAMYGRELALAGRLWEGLRAMDRVLVYGPDTYGGRVPIVLCNIEGMDPEDVSMILDGDFGIATRSGLHCAPLAHVDIGTYPRGAVRFSMGPLNTDEDIDRTLEAMSAIAKQG